MRLRPEGDQGPLARSLAATLGYYQTSGRTWERQALIKCRAVAGDLDLGPTSSRRSPRSSTAATSGGRDRRDQGDEAADRAADGLGGDGRRRGQDRARRDSRRRVRRPVPAAPPRRRVPRGPPRQHLGRALPARSGRLPDRRGARDHGRHVPLPPPGRAPVADHVRPADARDAPQPRRSADPGDPPRLPAGEPLGGPDRARRAVPGRLPVQDREEPGDPQPPAPRRLSRRGRPGRPGGRPGARPVPERRDDRGGARAVPVPRQGRRRITT